MIALGSLFFGAAMACVFFQSKGNIYGGDEATWSLAGFFMLLGLASFLKGVFSDRRLHDESHHSLP